MPSLWQDDRRVYRGHRITRVTIASSGRYHYFVEGCRRGFPMLRTAKLWIDKSLDPSAD